MNFEDLGDFYDYQARQDNSIETLNEGIKYLKIDKSKAKTLIIQSSNQGNPDANRYLKLLLYIENPANGLNPSPILKSDKRFLYYAAILLLEDSTITDPNQLGLGIRYLKKSIDLKYKRAAKYLLNFYCNDDPSRWAKNAIALAKHTYEYSYKKIFYRLLKFFRKNNMTDEFNNLLKYGIEKQDLYCLRINGETLKLAADLGDAKSMFKYANSIANSETIYATYLRKAARNGCLLAYYDLGSYYKNKSNTSQALKCISFAALHFDPDAQFSLGHLFLKDEDFNPDLSLFFFNLLAHKKFLVDKMEQESYWTEYSDDEELGSSDSTDMFKSDDKDKILNQQDDLVFSILYPSYVPKKAKQKKTVKLTPDEMNSIFEYTKKIEDLLEQRDPTIKKHRKVGIRKVKSFLGNRLDVTNSKFRKSEDEYVQYGYFGLGLTYQKLINWTKNTGELNQEYANRSIKSFEIANEMGNKSALMYIAKFYKDGSYTNTPNYQEALKYYNRIKEHNPDALFEIGQMYYNKQLPAQNNNYGIGLIKEASERGCEKAKQFFRMDSCIIYF